MDVTKNVKQFLQYLIVGALATLVEWIGFYLFNGKLGIYYMVATALAFAISTFANWLFGRLIVFRSAFKFDKALLLEIGKIYLTGIIGLLLNLIIMWIAVELFSCNEMLAKIIATGLVFFYNYFVRKLLIYKM